MSRSCGRKCNQLPAPRRKDLSDLTIGVAPPFYTNSAIGDPTDSQLVRSELGVWPKGNQAQTYAMINTRLYFPVIKLTRSTEFSNRRNERALVQFIDSAPTVRVVGVTQPDMSAMREMTEELGKTWGRDTDPTPESVAVFAGASCYLSYENKAGRSDAEYLRTAIVDHGHLSVIEHINVSFGVTNLPRSVQTEVIRHRAGSAYSFVSQRFVNTEGIFVVPPILRQAGSGASREVFNQSCTRLYGDYLELLSGLGDDYDAPESVEGTLRRKRLKEAARALLPNCTASSGVITYNARQLRHVITMRSDQHADASIREFAQELYLKAKHVVPYIFQDAEEKMVEGVLEITFTGGK